MNENVNLPIIKVVSVWGAYGVANYMEWIDIFSKLFQAAGFVAAFALSCVLLWKEIKGKKSRRRKEEPTDYGTLQ